MGFSQASFGKLVGAGTPPGVSTITHSGLPLGTSSGLSQETLSELSLRTLLGIHPGIPPGDPFGISA